MCNGRKLIVVNIISWVMSQQDGERMYNFKVRVIYR
jgi:hypothetical protein